MKQGEWTKVPIKLGKRTFEADAILYQGGGGYILHINAFSHKDEITDKAKANNKIFQNLKPLKAE